LSDEIKFEADLTGARWKMSRMMGLPFLLRKRLTGWAGETTEMAKRNVRGKYLNVRTAHLWRNIKFKIIESAEGTVGVAIGTGPDVGANKEVKYASIHEHGGTITPKKGKYLTNPFPGVKGTVRNFGSFGKEGNLFSFTSKKGNKIIAMRKWRKVRGGENSTVRGFIPLFLLKKEVHIPARHWLSQTINGQRMDLDRRMNPVTIIQEMLEGEAAFGD
jgi:hypothetical protein